MSDILNNASREELVRATEDNYIAYFEGFSCLPRLEFHRDPEISWFISDGPPGTSVQRTRFTSENADARIEETLQYFKSHTKSGWWQVLPSSQPADMPQRLLAHGLEKIEGRPVMTLDLSTLDGELNTSPNFRVELVKDEAGLRQWYEVSAAGFEATLDQVQVYFDAYECLGFGPDSNFLHYTGYLYDEAVTSSTLLLAGGIAGIYDVSTTPAARRQGFGRAITLAPLLKARAGGYHYAVLQSSHEGYNVYRQLGFSELYTEDNYFWKTDK